MHRRSRHVFQIITKRSRIFPVLGIIGPRQVGKTTFLMHEWQRKCKARYVTLDKFEIAQRAKREPENFLLSESNDLKTPLIIDEAQKAPALFDSIKAIIDERRRIGLFTVSGSVEFSDKSGIRESLAGRMGVCRLYPLTLCELAQQQLHAPWVKGWKHSVPERTSQEIDLWLHRGGMPIFCALHDPVETKLAIESWLEAICYRDLQQLQGARYHGDIARALLSAIAREPLVNVSRIAADTGANRSAIAKHLAALETLFLIHRLPSLSNRNGAPEYALFDTALVHYFLGNTDDTFARKRALRTLVINEILAQHEYQGESRPQLSFYRSRGGAELDLVLQHRTGMVGIDLQITSDITPYMLRSMKSFLQQHPTAQGVILAPVTERYIIDDIAIVPWTHLG